MNDVQAPVILTGDVALIESACRLVTDTIQLVGKSIRSGITTIELDAIAEDYILTNGGIPAFKGYGGHGSVPPFPYTLCISVNEEVVHGMPSGRILEEGDIVSIDCGVKKNDFFGDSAFTFPVGAISNEKRLLLDVTKRSLYAGIEHATHGNSNYDVGKAVQNVVEKNGFSCVRDLVGHGIGRNLHEDPSMPNFKPGLLHQSRYPKAKLRKGMTVAIEPMVNMGTHIVHTAHDKWTIVTSDGKPSAHFEHTIMVDEGRAIILTEV